MGTPHRSSGSPRHQLGGDGHICRLPWACPRALPNCGAQASSDRLGARNDRYIAATFRRSLVLPRKQLMADSDPAARPVLVLDFGAQYVQLIARRVRERHAFARIVRHDITAERVRELNPLALILSGGPSSVYEPGAPKCDPAIFKLGLPILGICYGMQLACQAMGAKVDASPAREFGRAECHVLDPSEPLFRDVPHETIVWMSHGDQLHDAGGDFLPLATTATCPIAAVRHQELPIYGLQFHPEVSHTPYGSLILGNFLDRICRNPRTWTMEAFIERSLSEINRRVGPDERVVCGLSGGVDSAVCAALLAKALGPRVVCVFVDTGLLRLGERDVGRRGVRLAHECRAPRDRCVRPISQGLEGSGRPARKAAANRSCLYRCLSRRGPLDPRRALPGPGNALSGRDRKRRRARRADRDHQDSPQRGRAPRGARIRADRAAARPVQGRSPPAGARARSAGRPGMAPSVPRSRSGRALSGRGDGRAARGPPPGRRHLPGRAACRRSRAAGRPGVRRAACRCRPWA